MSPEEGANPAEAAVPAYPENLACRVTVPLTPRNPYGIRICEYTARPGRGASETLYTMFALELALGGEKCLALSGAELHLVRGAVSVIAPGLYRVSESPGYASRIIFFNEKFPADFIQQNFKTVPVPDGAAAFACRLDEPATVWILNSLESIFREPKYFPCMSRAFLQDEFLRLLGRDSEQVRGFLSTAVFKDGGGLPAFMARHATENIGNDELARLYGASLSAFHKAFTAVFDTTPQKWLMDRRLERARVLLVSTTMGITQICYETGFKDPAHFTRAFRRKYGMPPTESRAGRG